jgi:hypothetical protein
MAKMRSQNVVQIAVEGTLVGKPHVNVWHLYSDEGQGNSDLDAVQDFANNFQDHIVPEMTNIYNLVGFNWLSLDPDDNNVGTLAPDPAKPVTGAHTGIVSPPNVAVLIHKNTSNRPRGARDGRSFMSGIPENLVGPEGALTAAYKAAWDAALQLFLDGVTDSLGGQLNPIERYPVVLETTPLSRAPGSQEVIVNSRKITQLVVDALAATQRDRLR